MEHAQLSNILAFKSVMAGSLFLVFPTFVYRNKGLFKGLFLILR